jgi:hypothetical protein
MALAVTSGRVELVQSVDWSLTTECTLPDQETSERRPYAPQGATGSNYGSDMLLQVWRLDIET